jgi:ABC-type lipoprotein release transport system permease subunit
MIYKLAWRNIWRNRRRTFITAASIMFAVFFAVFMESVQRGVWDHMLDNVIKFYYGYAQVHQKGYWEEQLLDKAFEWTEELEALESSVPEIKQLVPRIESFSLAAHGELTKGVLVVGIDPPVEEHLTSLPTRISEGSYLEKNDKAVIIGEGLAKALKVGLGDTLVLLSQGYHGANAAGKYPIKGLLDFGSPELSKRMVYLPLEEAQWFYGAENKITTLALQLDEKDDTPGAVQAVQTKLNTEDYEVLDWKEMIPDLVELRELKMSSNKLVLFILYLIISFGIFGTILMMTKEREYEFGILIAIGMSRLKIAATVWLETLFIGFIGVLAGMALSAPLCYYYHVNPLDLSVMGEEAVATYDKFGIEPVMPTAFDLDIFLTQAFTVFLVVTVLALYPLYKIWFLKPVEAMKN